MQDQDINRVVSKNSGKHQGHYRRESGRVWIESITSKKKSERKEIRENNDWKPANNNVDNINKNDRILVLGRIPMAMDQYYPLHRLEN